MASRKLELELEKRIVEKVIEVLFACKYDLGIYDYEQEREFITDHDKQKLMEYIFEYENPIDMYVHKNTTDDVSFVRFVPGQVQHIINDYGVSLEATLKPVFEYCNEYDD